MVTKKSPPDSRSTRSIAGSAQIQQQALDDEERVFVIAAELLSTLATPVRLKIVRALCDGERNVSDLLARINTSQPNISQHLSLLHRAGVIRRRREGTQIFYSLQSEKIATLCRTVVTQVAIELDDEDSGNHERLVPPSIVRIAT